jgi:hypothetical protein
METHLLSSGLCLARGVSGRKNRFRNWTSRATCCVMAIYVTSAVLPSLANAQGLFDNVCGTQQLASAQGIHCSDGAALNGGFTIITAPAGPAGGTGRSTVTQLPGTHIAVSSTVGVDGSVTVPGGGSLKVAGKQSVHDRIDLPVGTAPLSSTGFGSGMAVGSASSIGAGSANSNSLGNGDSFAGTANSDVGAGSSGGSGSSIGAGLGMGGGFGSSGSIH